MQNVTDFIDDDATFELQQAKATLNIEEARANRVGSLFDALSNGEYNVVGGRLIATELEVNSDLTSMFGPDAMDLDKEWESTPADFLKKADEAAGKKLSVSKITRGLVMGPEEKAYRAAADARIETKRIQQRGKVLYRSLTRKLEA